MSVMAPTGTSGAPDLGEGFSRPPGDPGTIAAQADVLRNLVSAVTKLDYGIYSTAGEVHGRWVGTASDAFFGEAQEAQRWAERIENYVNDLPQPLVDYSTALKKAQADWDAANAAHTIAAGAADAAVAASQTIPADDQAAIQQNYAAMAQARSDVLAALQAMQAAHDAALAANDAAAAAVNGAGSVDFNDLKPGVSFGSNLVAGIMGFGEDTNNKLPKELTGPLQWALRAASVAATYPGLENDNLNNDLMSEANANQHAAGGTIVAGLQTLGFTYVKAAGLVGRGLKQFGSSEVSSILGGDLESGEDAPNISPTIESNPYSVGGITPNHIDKHWVPTTDGLGHGGYWVPDSGPHVDPRDDAHPYGPSLDDVPSGH